MTKLRLTRRIAIIGTVTTAVAAGGSAAALATTQGSSDVYQGCLQHNLGALYNVKVNPISPPSCLRSDTIISWNQTGPAGAPGSQGPKGDTGPAGPAGLTGAIGPLGPRVTPAPPGPRATPDPPVLLAPRGTPAPLGPTAILDLPGRKDPRATPAPPGRRGPRDRREIPERASAACTGKAPSLPYPAAQQTATPSASPAILATRPTEAAPGSRIPTATRPSPRAHPAET